MAAEVLAADPRGPKPSGSLPPESLPSTVQATAASAAVAVSDPPSAPVAPVLEVPACWLAADAPEPVLDASKLQCYQVALELHGLASTLVANLNRIVRDQLERASLSIVLNIAEAGGRRSRRDKARYYSIARGSATEVAALFDVLALRRLAPQASIRSGRWLAIRVVQMLTRIDQRLVG